MYSMLQNTIFEQVRDLKRRHAEIEQKLYRLPASTTATLSLSSRLHYNRELTIIEAAVLRITQRAFLQKILPADQFCTLCCEELIEVSTLLASYILN